MTEDEAQSNRHKEALWAHVGANFLYLTLAQIASPSIRVRIDGIDSDKEDK
jgi:hypothetical protein